MRIEFTLFSLVVHHFYPNSTHIVWMSDDLSLLNGKLLNGISPYPAISEAERIAWREENVLLKCSIDIEILKSWFESST